MNVLVKHLNPSDIESFRADFERLDKDKSGYIEYQELSSVIIDSKFSMDLFDLRNIIKELDYAKDQRISYSEFIAASIDVSKFLTKEKLSALFSTFDVDNSGSITAKNLKDGFSKFNRDITDHEIEDIMKKHDIEKNGVINQHEFEQMMMEIL